MNKRISRTIVFFTAMLIFVSNISLVKAASDTQYATTDYVLIAHLQPQERISSGVWVNEGSKLGIMGSTGMSTGPHVHLEYRISSTVNCSTRVNPIGKLNSSQMYKIFGKSYKITYNYGVIDSAYSCGVHKGVDIIPSPNTSNPKVYSPVNGVVVESAYDNSFGYYVKIQIYK